MVTKHKSTKITYFRIDPAIYAKLRIKVATLKEGRPGLSIQSYIAELIEKDLQNG